MFPYVLLFMIVHTYYYLIALCFMESIKMTIIAHAITSIFSDQCTMVMFNVLKVIEK